MTREELEAVLALPKSHPARFLALYGSSGPPTDPVSLEEAQRLAQEFYGPNHTVLMFEGRRVVCEVSKKRLPRA